jgi:sec-independent protein translocase protein TatB
MFGLDFTEILVIVVVALIFLKPEDLPKVFRRLGQFYARITGMKNSMVNSLKEMEVNNTVRIVPPDGENNNNKEE